MWWLSELGWAGLEDGLGWPPCRFVLGFLSEPQMGGVEGWRTAVLSAWLFGPGGARNCLNRGFLGLKDGGCRRWLGLAWCPAVGERGWESVDDVGGFDGGVVDALDHGDDVVGRLLGVRFLLIGRSPFGAQGC